MLILLCKNGTSCSIRVYECFIWKNNKFVTNICTFIYNYFYTYISSRLASVNSRHIVITIIGLSISKTHPISFSKTKIPFQCQVVCQFCNIHQRSQSNSTNSNWAILLPPKALAEPMEYIHSVPYTDAHEWKKNKICNIL